MLVLGMFLLTNPAKAKLVDFETMTYIGSDDKDYKVIWCKDDVSNLKVSIVFVNSAEKGDRYIGWVKPNYNTDFMSTINRGVVSQSGVEEFPLGSIYEPQTYLPKNGKVKVNIHKSILDIKKLKGNMIEISAADNSKVDVVDLSTGIILMKDVNIKGGNIYQTISLESLDIDTKRPYGVVVKQNGEVLKTEIFYFNK